MLIISYWLTAVVTIIKSQKVSPKRAVYISVCRLWEEEIPPMQDVKWWCNSPLLWMYLGKHLPVLINGFWHLSNIEHPCICMCGASPHQDGSVRQLISTDGLSFSALINGPFNLSGPSSINGIGSFASKSMWINVRNKSGLMQAGNKGENARGRMVHSHVRYGAVAQSVVCPGPVTCGRGRAVHSRQAGDPDVRAWSIPASPRWITAPPCVIASLININKCRAWNIKQRTK